MKPSGTARAHCGLARSDLLSASVRFSGQEAEWPECMASGLDPVLAQLLRANTYLNRPTGSEAFIDELEHNGAGRVTFGQIVFSPHPWMMNTCVCSSEVDKRPILVTLR